MIALSYETSEDDDEEQLVDDAVVDQVDKVGGPATNEEVEVTNNVEGEKKKAKSQKEKILVVKATDEVEELVRKPKKNAVLLSK